VPRLTPRRSALLAALPALLLARPAAAWQDHYLLTEAALQADGASWANEPVTVEPLEPLLRGEEAALRGLFEGYYAWLKQRGKGRCRVQRFEGPTVEAFNRAARLHPDTRYALVERALPGEPVPGAPVRAAEVSAYLPDDPSRATFVDSTQGTLPARIVLATFSDEPDWGMDIDLWDPSPGEGVLSPGPPLGYGYGPQPYGRRWGQATQAPFHQLFLNEPEALRFAEPDLVVGMPEERMELFRRLSRLAMETGHPYWGWRFAAWYVHYAQDLAEPYNGNALPGADTATLKRVGRSPDAPCLLACAFTLRENRQTLYEEFVSRWLEAAHRAGAPVTDPLLSALHQGATTFPDTTVGELLARLGALALVHGPAVDAAIVAAFPAALHSAPDIDLREDPRYTPERALASLSEPATKALLTEAGADLQAAGVATRTALALLLADLPSSPPP
jgi:hypothetical protein